MLNRPASTNIQSAISWMPLNCVSGIIFTYVGRGCPRICAALESVVGDKMVKSTATPLFALLDPILAINAVAIPGFVHFG